ncbi:MAG: hypothetical protein GX049_00455 [Alcaligenaceae bacterium]|nr:hypothetical protein [Alcaligenaceae bacterium]
MRRLPAPTDRLLKIELLRARAELERQTVRHTAKELAGTVSASSLLNTVLSQFSARSALGWVAQASVLSRRYPFILSAVTAAVSGVGRKGRWLKVGLSLLAGWQLVRTARSKPEPRN